MARPDLNVFVLMGDGDACAIGGNHLIHACRRNIDLTAIIFNNSIYGMTGGQYSPLTPRNKKAATAPYGLFEQSFDICRVAEAAGATFVGRATTYHNQLLIRLITEGVKNRGFSLVEAVTHCPTSFGRRNDMASPADMVRWQKENSVHIEKIKSGKSELKDGQFTIGVLHQHQAPEFTAEYMEVVRRARKGRPVT